MRLSVLLPYDREITAAASLVPAYEAAGVDGVWVPEAWGFDSPTLMGWLAARTTRIDICAGVLNVYSRTATAIAQTAAGLDAVSGGRAVLGLGTSGPQVIEGWHGVAFDDPLGRIADTVATVRRVLRREVVDQRPLIPPGHGTGLGKPLRILIQPVRERVPIVIAALGPASVRQTARIADGWIPMFYRPESADRAFGEPLRAGLADRDPVLGKLSVVAGGILAIEDAIDRGSVAARQLLARYIGGMGAKGANFYFDLATRYGFGDAAQAIQERYLAGAAQDAERLVPEELVHTTQLVGSTRHVIDRVDAYRAAGVSELMVSPAGDDPVGQVSRLRRLLDG